MCRDKSGAYGIQDGLASTFVRRIDGCYFNGACLTRAGAPIHTRVLFCPTGSGGCVLTHPLVTGFPVHRFAREVLTLIEEGAL